MINDWLSNICRFGSLYKYGYSELELLTVQSLESQMFKIAACVSAFASSQGPRSRNMRAELKYADICTKSFIQTLILHWTQTYKSDVN